MLKELREEVLEANLDLVRRGLVLYTFGNASGISRAEGLVVIKPSGVPYETMKPEDLVITDLDGKIVEGKLRVFYANEGVLVYQNFVKDEAKTVAQALAAAGLTATGFVRWRLGQA